MKTFHVKFTRDFEVDVQAESLEAASHLAKQVTAQFATGSCKILSVIEDGYIEPPEAANSVDIHERRNAQLASKVREITGEPERFA